MPKEKVTLTLDAQQMRVLRELVGARSLSSGVDAAVLAHVARLRHLAAVDEWIAELDRKYGPVPPETMEWASQIFDKFEAERARVRRRKASRAPAR